MSSIKFSYLRTFVLVTVTLFAMSARRKTATPGAVPTAPSSTPSFGVAAFNDSPLVQSLRKQTLARTQAGIGHDLKDPNDMIMHILQAASMKNVAPSDTKEKKMANRSDRREIIKKVLDVMKDMGLTAKFASELNLAANLRTIRDAPGGMEAIKEIYMWVEKNYTYKDSRDDEESDYKSAESDVEARFRLK